MKNILYIFIAFILYTNICSGQKTKHIVIKSSKPNNIKERMLVLKSNPHIKKGKYTKHKNNILIESGYYSYNQKDSFWEYFSKQGKLMAKGFYKDGDKKGIWEYYSINSDLIQTYDHDNDSLTYYNIEKEKELYPYLAPQKNQMIVLKCAILLGDWAIYIEYLKTKHYTRK